MTKEKVFISEADQYLFAQGTHYDIYKKLGAHLSVEDGVQGVYFGVWAPNAAQVNVIGTFNEWNEESHPMQKLGEGGIWGLFIPGVEEGTMYKFLIYARDGRKLYKADPFANYAEYRPGTASIVTDITGFDWRDSKWMEARDKKDMNKEPMAIYECHIGSFMNFIQYYGYQGSQNIGGTMNSFSTTQWASFQLDSSGICRTDGYCRASV
jgi:1,4-alpha-glucan branching enzyme